MPHDVEVETGRGEREPGAGSAVPGDDAGGVVIGQHPGRRGADRLQGRQGQVDDVALRRRRPLTHQGVEVEGGVQLVGPDIPGEFVGRGDPRLGDENARAELGVGVRVRDGSPAAQDVVDVGLVEVRRAGQHIGDRPTRARDRRRGPAAPAVWPSSSPRRSGSRPPRGRTRTAGSRRTRRPPRGCPSSSPAVPGRTGAGTTGPGSRPDSSCGPRRRRRTCSASCWAAPRPPPRSRHERGRGPVPAIPGAAARAARNQGCWSLLWFGTRSMRMRNPRSCARRTNSSACSRVPKSGWMSR